MVMTQCPAPVELLLHALQRLGDQPARRLSQHVGQCASCQEAVAGLREAASTLGSLGTNTPETPDCLDEMTVSVVAERGVSLADDPDLITHLATCARCREQVASVARLLRQPAVVAETERTKPRPATDAFRWRFAGAVVTALAAGVTFMVVGSSDRTGMRRPAADLVDAPAHREPSLTTTVAPTLIAPLGAVTVADTFRWMSVPRADRYRLTVFDREGTLVWEAAGLDTAMAPPASITHRRNTACFWKVEARTSRDRWVESELFEFSVVPNVRIP